MAPLRKLAAVFVTPSLALPALALAALAPAPVAPAALNPAPLAQVGPAVSASAAERVATQQSSPGNTYWGYYIWKDAKTTWAYSPVGANDTKNLPDDGDVYGFRWALVVKDPRLPRADGDFEAICGDVRNDEGEKRIAFVIDYGAETDAVADDTTPPARGVCSLVDESFTVQQALQTVAEVRTDDSGLICAIDSYPSEGCGEQFADVAEPAPDEQVTLQLPRDETGPTPGGDDNQGGSDPTPSDDRATGLAEDDDSNVLPVVIAGVVVIALGFSAVLLRRRQG